MSNRNYYDSNKFSQNYRSSSFMNDQNRCKLPAINNGTATMTNMNPLLSKPSTATDPYASQVNENYSNLRTSNNPSLQVNGGLTGPAAYNTRTPSYNNCKVNCPPSGVASSPFTSRMYNGMQQVPTNQGWSPNQFGGGGGGGKMNTTNMDINKATSMNPNMNYVQRPMTSGPGGSNCPPSTMNIAAGQKAVLRDRHLANEILQKAGIPSNLTANDCLEVISDTPVTMSDNVNCDPNPLCMKKPADCQECYEQSIVVRHLQPPRPPVPPPIIIRERCAPQPPPQPPIVIRQIPPRASTPPPLIIRECPPPMPDRLEPTIIEREVPPPPAPPRQVIVERLATPPPKPRSIIFEKWLPYEEPADRPCIVEKAAINEMPPLKNIIIQYEAVEPRIQPQCIDEGISYVDPKQFVNDRPSGNAEIYYVDQLNNLPEHIKRQLSPQTLAAIGIQNNSKQNSINNPSVVRTNPPAFYQQNGRLPCNPTPSISPGQSMTMNGSHSAKPSYSQLCNPNMYRPQQQPPPGNRALSASVVGLPQCYDRYNPSLLARPGNQGLTNLARTHYNPWATTYQVSYTNKARGMCRAR